MTFVGLFIGVNSLVYLQHSLEFKSGRASLTFKWFMLGVSLRVHLEMRGLRESFVADVTFKWLFSRMTPFVRDQIDFLPEC